MPETRSQEDAAAPKTHILDFYRDKDDGCALTVRVNNARFHIVVDPPMLKEKNDHSVFKQYHRLYHAVEARDESDGGNTSENTSNDRDSGVDITADQDKAKSEIELQNWLLSCFAEETAELAPAPANEDTISLEEWYKAPVHFFEVVSKEGKLQPERLDESEILQKRIDDLFPKLPVPKKLRDLDIPHVNASDYTLLQTSEDPPPVHPSHLKSRKDGKVYFFKPVDPTMPQPTKREIQLHYDIESRGLQSEIRVPKLHGLVMAPHSHVEIMGMLLTVIEDPTPMTKLLDSEVDESKRQRWARETKQIIKALHDKGLVWGDAKGDNFMVDKNDDVWIIDFGGSYTEGWVDPENMETIEGDEEGLEKVVNALKDPDNATINMEEEDKKRQEKERDVAKTGKKVKSTKRRHDDVSDEDEHDQRQEPEQKKEKLDAGARQTNQDAQHEEDESEHEDKDEAYCFCDGPSSGEMIACDGSDCARKWFHLECVALESAPSGEWLCEECGN